MRIVYTRTSDLYNDSRATKEITALLGAGYYVSFIGWNRTGRAVEECEKLFKNYKSNFNSQFYTVNENAGILDKISARMKWGKWLYGRLKEEKSIDIIHACDFDTGWIVKRYCKKNSVPFVYDIFDYYSDAHEIPLGLKRIVGYFEDSIVNQSDVTIICTEERREQIKKAKPRNIIVIHNSPDVRKLVEDYNVSYDYAYCGMLNDGRLLKEIFGLYEKNSDLRFVVAGNGVYAEMAERLDKKYPNFKFLGNITYEEVLKTELKTIILSAVYDPVIRNHRLCAPNKFYEALALGKPIIVCKDTGIDKVVSSYGLGEVISYNASEFYKAIRRIIDNKEKNIMIRQKAKGLYDKEYSWGIMQERLLAAYKLIR